MDSHRDVNNSEDILDSRDIIARIKELEFGQENAKDISFDQEEQDELRILKALAEEGASAPDWEHGETLIRDSYFRAYAEELAEDVCEMPSDVKWPYTHIDWDAAAEELKMDYFIVDFDGVEYWIQHHLKPLVPFCQERRITRQGFQGFRHRRN